MVALFKEKSPAAVVWLFILSVVVHSNFFVHPPTVQAAEEDGLISVFLNDYLLGVNPTLLIFLYHLLVLVQALRLNFLFNDNRMFSRNNFLTAMVYIILTGIFAEWANITPALVANIIIIWLYAKTIHLYNTPNPKTLLFNIGLIIGVSIILYHPTTLLILVALFAVMIVRPFRITEWLVLLMGVVAPFYFLFSFLYLTNRLKRIEQYIPDWELNLPDVVLSAQFFVTIGLIVLVILVGLYYWQDQSRRMLIQVRKNWSVLVVMLIVMLPLPFISRNANLDALLLWIVPVSPFMAKGFLSPKKNTLPNIMFWSLIIIGIINTWQLIKN